MQERITKAINALKPGVAMMGSTGNVVLPPEKAEEIIALIDSMSDRIEKLEHAQKGDHGINRALKESLDKNELRRNDLEEEVAALWYIVGLASKRILEDER